MTSPKDSPSAFNWRCAFGLHPWAKWSALTAERYTVQTGGGLDAYIPLDKPYKVTIFEQTRTCPTCGRTQRKAKSA